MGLYSLTFSERINPRRLADYSSGKDFAKRDIRERIQTKVPKTFKTKNTNGD